MDKFIGLKVVLSTGTYVCSWHECIYIFTQMNGILLVLPRATYYIH